MSLRRLALAVAIGAVFVGPAVAKDYKLLNVSYDPTRELYVKYNAEFTKYWEQQHPGDKVEIQQSHGGSGKQALSVINGLKADVVTLALAGDIDAIAEKGFLAKNWQTRLPDASTPYTSTIVFLVRKGNPKGIKDWDDLIKPGVSVITPNPKTSGGARWNFLAAYAYGLKANNGDEAKATAYIKELFKHVPVLDTGARGSTITFTEKGQGDVLLAWENEAFLSLDENNGEGKAKYDIVVPPLSILAEPPVAVVDKTVDKKEEDKKGSRQIAEAYLNHLYSDAGQRIAAQNYYRPRDAKVAEEFSKQFPKLDLVKIDDPIFGGWEKAQPKFFGDGGVFDQIYQP